MTTLAAAEAKVRARAVSTVEAAGWDDLVTGFAGRRVVHRRAWLESLARCGQGEPLLLVVERGGMPVGCLPGLLTRVGPLRVFGSPLPGWQTASMGPLFDPDRVSAHAVVQACLQALERDHGVQHVELVSGLVDADAMTRLGFEGQDVPTFRAPLHPGDETRTFRQLRDSARRNVQRADRLGLELRLESSASFAPEAYRQIGEVFIRGGNAVPFPLARVEAFLSCMQAAGTLVAVSARLPDTGECIACALFTISDGELLLWQWAHRPEHRWYRATEALTWTAMRQAMARGCTTMDLMGEGQFKANFGATLQAPHRRWIRSRYPWLTPLRHAAERGYRWQQGLRGRYMRWVNDRRAPVPAPTSRPFP